ncbi:hypothetical protein GCM10010448_06510 [Streptomyces glomeratus]|uniref:Uncharacterized protein n=1 Tax=Streptomyces glomeratus TaxID=284452 RepID=A0ABP6KYL8_9ACTN
MPCTACTSVRRRQAALRARRSVRRLEGEGRQYRAAGQRLVLVFVHHRAHTATLILSNPVMAHEYPRNGMARIRTTGPRPA